MRQCAPAVYLDFWTSAYQAIDDQAASVPMALAAPAARSFKPSAAVPPKNSPELSISQPFVRRNDREDGEPVFKCRS
jgi:hypothetical protein